jgi:hypothetical protein
MLVILLLKRWSVYNVDSWIVSVEVSRHKNIGCWFGRKLREDLGVSCGFLLAKEECRAWAMFVCMSGFVAFQLIFVLLFVF